jgi:O-antigen/teichoic acid export membrane protein
LEKLKSYHFDAVVSGSAVAFVLRIAGVFLVFLQDVAMGRWLGAEGYGVFSFFRSVFITISLVAIFGLNISSVKFTSIYFNDKKSWAHLRGFVLWSKALVFLNSAIAVAVVLVFAWFFFTDQSHQFLMTFCAASCLIPLVSLSKLHQGFLRGLERVACALLPEEVIVPAVTLLLMYVYASHSILTATTCMWIYDLANAAALIAIVIIVRTSLKLDRDDSRIYEWPMWLKVSLPIFFTNLTTQLLGQTEIFLLGKFRLMSEVGLFTVANRVAALANLPMNIVCLVIVPIIAREFSRGDRQELKRIVHFGASVSFWGAILISLPLFLAPDFFLGLFGREFLIGKLALFILLGGNVLNAFCGPNGQLLIMTGHEVFLFKAFLFSLIFDLCVALMVIPQGGVLGAAIASTATKAVRNFILDIACRKKLGVSPSARLSPKS